MNRTKSVFAIVISLSIYAASAQVKRVSYGTHEVGFLSISRYDDSRPAVKEQAEQTKGRLLQINVWFPAFVKGNKQPISFRDYVTLIGKELNEMPAGTQWKQKAIDSYFAWPASTGADKNLFTNYLNRNEKLKARQGITPGKNAYPLIMLVHGFCADYAWLGEYLASYGYTVLQVPVKGTNTAELDYETNGLATQVLDYEFALKILQSEYSIWPLKSAVLGFSFGGQSAMALAIKHPEIKAVVSFDGGIGSAFGADLLKRQSFFDLSKIKAPLVHFYNPSDPYTNISWLKSLKGISRHLVAMKNVEHGHFTSFGLLNNVLPGIMGKSSDPGDAYETMMNLTRIFLDTALKTAKKDSGNFVEIALLKYPWMSATVMSSQFLERSKS